MKQNMNKIMAKLEEKGEVKLAKELKVIASKKISNEEYFEYVVMWLEHRDKANRFGDKFDKVMEKFLGKGFNYEEYMSTGGGRTTADNLIDEFKNRNINLSEVNKNLKIKFPTSLIREVFPSRLLKEHGGQY